MNEPERYYLIGDVHGHKDRLEALLDRIWAEEGTKDLVSTGAQLIFVGDLIDKGPDPAGALHIAHELVEDGQALLVIGNHELNWLMDGHDEVDEALLAATGKRHERRALAESLKHDPHRLSHYWEWLTRQPVFIDRPEIRVVHACWHSSSISDLKKFGSECMDEPARRGWKDTYSAVHIALDRVVAGCQHRHRRNPGPEDFPTRRDRIRWWHDAASAMDAEGLTLPLAADRQTYPEQAQPVFFGHYALSAPLACLSHNQACLDFGVAYGGSLVGYRHGVGKPLARQHFLLE